MKSAFLRPIKLFILVLSIFVFNSCSPVDGNSTSLSIGLPRDLLSRAGDITLEEGSDLHVLAIIRGKQTESYYDTLSEDSLERNDALITIYNMPVGDTVTVELNIFSSEGYWINGLSNPLKIHRGLNEVEIELKGLNADEQSGCHTYSCTLWYNSIGVNDQAGWGNLKLSLDGFYELTAGYSGEVISKGTWKGSPSFDGGQVYLTEYMYKPIIPPEIEWPAMVYLSEETIICTEPNVYELLANEYGWFEFITKSGVSVSGSFQN
ncbi:MAG: hypothetical protein J6S91_01835 [Treponema sp.]|nr:hypothetical protein [Treponema sp.]